MRTTLFILATLILFPIAAAAQDTALFTSGGSPSRGGSPSTNRLTADLHFLTRGEIRDGGIAAAAPEATLGDHANFVLGRSRLTLGFEKTYLSTRLDLRQLGIWGQAGGSAFNVYEAWARLSALSGLFLQAGRQTLSYDDERIIGPNDWAMAGTSHDALKLGFEGCGHKAHLILAYNQNEENMTNGSSFYTGGALPYKTMQTVWYHYDLPLITSGGAPPNGGAPSLGISLLMMNIGMQAGQPGTGDHIEWQQVYGGYAKYAPSRWSLEASYYRQSGHNENGKAIKAWMASLLAKWQPQSAFGFKAGFDYLSGDDYFVVAQQGNIGLIQHDTLRGFTSVFGSHHQFYGAMDFFYISTFVNGFSPGLQNAFIGTYVKPINNLRIYLDYHYLAMSTRLPDIDMDMTLGHELELEASWQIKQDVTLSLGLSLMVGTKSMERLKRASTDGSLRWAWLALNITPRILTKEW
ncbi:MAG: hypothetical protein IJ785_01895 [Bacteroidales bacterium]|nr:hypothetical protein [Bacteroidales bacterium]